MVIELCSACGEDVKNGGKVEGISICYDCLLKEQVERMANLSESDFSHVTGYRLLTDSQKDLLFNVYKKHLNGLGTVSRQDFMPEQLKKVEWDKRESTLKVYFEKDWFHYNKDHSWY